MSPDSPIPTYVSNPYLVRLLSGIWVVLKGVLGAFENRLIFEHMGADIVNCMLRSCAVSTSTICKEISATVHENSIEWGEFRARLRRKLTRGRVTPAGTDDVAASDPAKEKATVSIQPTVASVTAITKENPADSEREQVKTPKALNPEAVCKEKQHGMPRVES